MSKHVTVRMADFPSLSFDDVQNMHSFLDIYEATLAKANAPKAGP